MTKVPEEGYQIIGLNIKGLQRRLTLENFLFPFKVISSLRASVKILKEFNPDVVVGFGGYASSPITMAAAWKKIPVLLQEQNSYAGLANKVVARRSSKICVAYEHMERYFPKHRIIHTGNPVRKAILQGKNDQMKSKAHFGLASIRKTILVIGGSLGARTINESIIQNIQEIVASPFQLLWQAGSLYYRELTSRMVGLVADNVHIKEFIKEMDMAYAAADLVISRAGALTISELCIVGKPVIFIPSPNVAEDHQTKNAIALVQKDAAMIIPDEQAIHNLIQTAFDCLENSDKLATLSRNIKKLAKPNATRDIAHEVLELIK